MSSGVNGLPQDLDLSFLQGHPLVSIDITQHQVQLRFSDDVRVSIECDVALKKPKASERHIHLAADLAGPAAQLLGEKVTIAENLGSGTLGLTFESGVVISIFDSNSRYESYQLHDGETVHVV